LGKTKGQRKTNFESEGDTMKVFKPADAKLINSNTCGKLVELLNQPDIPISITVAENLKPTKKHSHKESTEIYWVQEGFVEIEVNGNERTQKVILENNAILVVSPGETHQVVASSERNKVVVLSSPRWTPEGEILS
jgi:mannose-6-phosphate isomerase-like protein (cupin superfamily)